MRYKTIHLWIEYHRKKEEKYVFYPAVKDDDGNIIDEEESKILDTKWEAPRGWREFLHDDYLMAVSLAQLGVNESDEQKSRGLPDDVSTYIKERTLSFNGDPYPLLNIGDDCPRPIFGEGYGMGFGPNPPAFTGSTSEEYVQDPRFYGFSWCNAKELEDCIKKNYYDETTQKYNPDAIDWIILLGAMNALDGMGNIECRAVFWFED